MTRVLHLVAHDLRSHRLLLLIWVAIVLTHPMTMLMSWERPLGPLPLPAILIVVARLIIGTVLLGSILQQDSPIDERAFWRTRPIAPWEMAAAKLITAATFFLLLPLLVVLATASVVDVPAVQWPAVAGRVLVIDGALAGLTMAVATRTRRTSTLLIAIVASLLAGYLLLVSMVEMSRLPRMAAWLAAARLDFDIAWPTMCLWASVGLWWAAAIGFAGYRRRNAFALAGAATVAAMLVTLLLPQARLHARSPAEFMPVTLTIGNDDVRAERLPGLPLIGIVATPSVAGVQEGDRVQAFLLDGRITAAGFSKAARGDGQPRAFLTSLNQPQVPLLAVLTDAEFAALAGNPASFTGRLNVEIARKARVAEAPLAAGSALVVGGTRLAIHRILEPSSDMPQPVAEGMLTEYYTVDQGGRRGREFRLRDRQSGCSAVLYPRLNLRSQMAFVALLPTLARPFGVQSGTLVAMDDAGCRPDPAASLVEAYELRSQLSAVPLSVDFTMPSVIEAAPSIRLAR